MRQILDQVHNLKRALGEDINREVDAAGWTQNQMAEELGISQSTASYVRRGAVFKVSTDALIEMAGVLGIRVWAQHPLPPEWVDQAVRGGVPLVDRELFDRDAERPLGLGEAGAYTYPGKSPTELVRLLAGTHGWRIYGGALYTAEGELLATSLEVAAAAMVLLRWIRPESGDLGWHRDEGDDVILLRTAVARVRGRVVSDESLTVRPRSSGLGEFLLGSGVGDRACYVQVQLSEDGWLKGSCVSCGESVDVTLSSDGEPLISQHHFECDYCSECVVFDEDPRPDDLSGAGIGPVYCEGIDEHNPGCEMEAGFRAAIERD